MTARWKVTLVAVVLLLLTLPIPDGLVRWALLAVILAGWLVAGGFWRAPDAT